MSTKVPVSGPISPEEIGMSPGIGVGVLNFCVCEHNDRELILNGPPSLIKIANRAAIPQVGVIRHAILVSNHMAFANPAIGGR